MPAFHAASTAWQSGSVLELPAGARPRDMLITRMLYFDFSAIAWLIAAITLLSAPEPFWSSTRRSMKLTVGAMPRMMRLASLPDDFLPLPPRIPATCEP